MSGCGRFLPTMVLLPVSRPEAACRQHPLSRGQFRTRSASLTTSGQAHLHIREQLSTIVDTPCRAGALEISWNQRLSEARFAREFGMADAMFLLQKRRYCDVMETTVVSRINFLNLVPPVLLGVSMAAAAYGADSGFYLGADLGRSDYPANVKFRVDSSTLASGNLSNHDLGWAITGGYRFNRYVAIEAGYLDLGTLSGPLANIAGASTASGHFDLSVRGATQAVVGILPFGNWEGYLKLGYFYSDVRLSLSGVSGAGPFNYKASVSDLSEWAGVGLRYRLAQHWQVNVEYDRYGSVGDRGKTGTYTNSTPSVGFAYRF
jgi:OOP family OmpA-OmpF porin